MNNICINFFLEITRGTTQKLQAKRVIIPPDERKQLPSSSKAQKSPHSAACKVSCKGFCTWSCSGTLIGPHHVLTSAHCIDGVDVATLQVGFLERNGRLQWYDVMKASMPLRWKITKKKYDYAVLKLKGRANRRSYVSVVSVSLPKNSLISITGKLGASKYRSYFSVVPYLTQRSAEKKSRSPGRWLLSFRTGRQCHCLQSDTLTCKMW